MYGLKYVSNSGRDCLCAAVWSETFLIWLMKTTIRPIFVNIVQTPYFVNLFPWRPTYCTLVKFLGNGIIIINVNYGI